MNFPASLSQQLSDLTDALDDPGTDLQAILALLVDDLTAAVPSFLGLTTTLRVDGESVALAAIEADALRAPGRHCICRSIRWPAPVRAAPWCSTSGTWTRSRNWLRKPDVCMGSTVTYSTGTCRTGDAVQPPMVTDPAQRAVIHRAMGLLIDQGQTPERADHEVRRRAAATCCALADAAHHLLRTGAAADLGPAP